MSKTIVLLVGAAATVVSIAVALRSSGQPLQLGPPLPSPAEPRLVRIRALSTGSWALANYDAPQVLDIIANLNPTLLERYTSENVNPNYIVPGGNGMTAAEFIDASCEAATPTCEWSARLSMEDYAAGTFFTTAEKLYDLPVQHPAAQLSLDNWPAWAMANPTLVTPMFEQLESIGWTSFAVNDGGGYTSANGYAQTAEAVMDTTSWLPNATELAAIHADPSIKQALLYIDFPGQVDNFLALPPAQQVSIMTYNAAQQAPQDYTFVYNIVQEGSGSVYDSLNLHTPSGTLYQVAKSLMLEYPG